MNIPELLAPAGSPEALTAALSEGADAVYLGLKNFNARLRGANFAYAQFEGALRAAHKLGKKVYVAVNTVFIERETDRMYQLLKYLADTGPDAIIVQDLGVLAMARNFFPALTLHASTQMNISSAASCELLAASGVKRAVLAR
ncbi:MAG: U32 family peptidase, partial [Spirochaetaceae bacterium]|nr:U32 family peptidase [Spirochaetaceae bacterium]